MSVIAQAVGGVWAASGAHTQRGLVGRAAGPPPNIASRRRRKRGELTRQNVV
ncbi:MAG: hypothetical protein JXA21_10315 [Anaerolineae bacterium]|nr:hypothetical protein [Anaerolineae bacterium]